MEYFYGGGVQAAVAGSTPYGHPVEVVDLGCAATMQLVHSHSTQRHLAAF
jgi:hypothetical protein